MKQFYWTAARLKGGGLNMRDRHGSRKDALEYAAKILVEKDMDEVVILKEILQVRLPEEDDD